MLPPPVQQRRGIPFYIEKSAADFQADPYERYDEHVTRQLGLHYGIQPYAWQLLENWFFDHLPASATILEVGCGVGQLIGRIALKFPKAKCYGFDYSYQMLSAANRYWRSSQPLEWQQLGFPDTFYIPPRNPVAQLEFGLADASKLPFPNNSVDTIISSFLFDRLDDPSKALIDWKRVIKPAGQLLIASPLNFQQSQHWKDYYPIEKLLKVCRSSGWQVNIAPTRLLLRQSLDAHGNSINWQTLCWGLTH